MSKKARFTTIICTVLMCIIVAAAFMLIRVLATMSTDGLPKLVFSSESLDAKYDGAKLTGPKWSLDSGELKEGHEAVVTVSGAQVNAGESQNYIAVRIVDEKGKDVTSEYDIELKPGTLTVKHVTLMIMSDNNSKVYDGTPLTDDGYTIISGERDLPPQCELKLDITGSITEIGSVDNTIESVVVLDSNGADISRNFEFRLIFGKLVVTDEAGNSWGGDDLLSGFPEVPGLEDLLGAAGGALGGILGGEWPEIPGESELGELPEFPSTGGGNGEGDGDGDGDKSGALDLSGGIGSGGDSSEQGEPVVCYQVVGSRNGIVYLKTKSFGAYLGQKWIDAVDYKELAEGKYSGYYLTSAALKEGGGAESEIAIKVLNGQFVLPYYTDAFDNDESFLQEGDVICKGESGEVYILKYYGANGLSGAAPYEEWSEFEDGYRDYVYKNYTQIDEVSLEYFEKLILEEGFDRNSPEVVNEVAKYIQKSATYNLKYDSKLDSEENIAIAFLETYKEGICQHYATAATLLYRALGIPARYTIGFVANVKAGEVSDVTSEKAHAWVEVYYDDIGWIMVEVTGGADRPEDDEGEEEEEEKPEFELKATPVQEKKKYDGKPFDHSGALDLEGFEEFAEQGYQLSYEWTERYQDDATSLGMHYIHIDEITIHVTDPAGQDVSEKFYVTCLPGSVQIYHTELVFRSEGRTMEYDGTELIGTPEDCSLFQGTLMEGHYAEYYNFEGITEVGEHANRYRVRIYDASGENVTSWYSITRKLGKLTVTPRSVTIKPEDKSQVYDKDNPLICPSLPEYLEIVSGSLVDGHEVSWVKITGSQTKPGKSQSIIESIIIVDADGNDVTFNYAITTDPGELKVTYR